MLNRTSILFPAKFTMPIFVPISLSSKSTISRVAFIPIKIRYTRSFILIFLENRKFIFSKTVNKSARRCREKERVGERGRESESCSGEREPCSYLFCCLCCFGCGVRSGDRFTEVLLSLRRKATSTLGFCCRKRKIKTYFSPDPSDWLPPLTFDRPV